jgi:hypothetical protein
LRTSPGIVTSRFAARHQIGCRNETAPVLLFFKGRRPDARLPADAEIVSNVRRPKEILPVQPDGWEFERCVDHHAYRATFTARQSDVSFSEPYDLVIAAEGDARFFELMISL